MSDAAPKRLLMGRIGAAHGIKGEVRIHSFTAEPMTLAGYGTLETSRPGLTVEIETARLSGEAVLVARLKGVADRTAAERLNGVELFVGREHLPEPEADDFYHVDLVGLEARLEDGTVLGRVVGVPNYGASDLIEVRDERSGDIFLYPFTRAVVPEVHVAEGYLVIAVPTDADPGEEEPD
ncbi:MAG: ribosome maturation factor RimM [Devosia sp.]